MLGPLKTTDLGFETLDRLLIEGAGIQRSNGWICELFQLWIRYAMCTTYSDTFIVI